MDRRLDASEAYLLQQSLSSQHFILSANLQDGVAANTAGSHSKRHHWHYCPSSNLPTCAALLILGERGLSATLGPHRQHWYHCHHYPPGLPTCTALLVPAGCQQTLGSHSKRWRHGITDLAAFGRERAVISFRPRHKMAWQAAEPTPLASCAHSALLTSRLMPAAYSHLFFIP